MADAAVAQASRPDNGLTQVGTEEGFNVAITLDGGPAAGVAKAGAHFQVSIGEKVGRQLLTMARTGNDRIARWACIVDLRGYSRRIHASSL